jgi:hypothetical protein
MRSWSLLPHVCAGVMMALVVFVLVADIYSQSQSLPPCNGQMPGPSGLCGSASNPCPDYQFQNTCTDPNSVCVQQQTVPGNCVTGALSQRCESYTATCTKTFLCNWSTLLGGFCYCGSNPKLDSKGNPIVSTTTAGTLVSCQEGG